jgi:hypothetical protein
MGAGAHNALRCSWDYTTMLAILIAIRDSLIAMALAWVGVTLEAQRTHAEQPACGADACQPQSSR